MWSSDKSSSLFPLTWWRPRPWSLAAAYNPAGWMLSRSRSEKCPFSPLPFGQAVSGDLYSGPVAHVQAMASSCLLESSFREGGLQHFGGCWAECSWSLAGDVGELVICSRGNSWRLAASSSVTKTGMMWTFGGRMAPRSCRASPPVGSLWSRGAAGRSRTLAVREGGNCVLTIWPL